MGNLFTFFSKTPNSSTSEELPSSPFESLSDEKKRLYREIFAKSASDCKTIVLSGFSLNTTRLKIIHTHSHSKCNQMLKPISESKFIAL